MNDSHPNSLSATDGVQNATPEPFGPQRNHNSQNALANRMLAIVTRLGSILTWVALSGSHLSLPYDTHTSWNNILRTAGFSIDLQCLYDILLLMPVPLSNKRHIMPARHLSRMLSCSHLSLSFSPLPHFHHKDKILQPKRKSRIPFLGP